MPYRRTRRIRRTRRRAPWYKRRYNALQLASKAARGVWYLKGLVNSEMHHLVTNSTVSVTNTATIIPLTAIGQDDTASGRTGNSILLRNIFMRWGLTNNPAASSTYFRCLLVQDKQQIGDTAPTITDVLQSSSTLSSLSLNSAGRFKILKDWFFILNNVDKTSRNAKLYLDVRKHVRFNGAAGTDIQKNGIYMMVLSDQVIGTAPSFVYNVKLGWHDN